MHFAPSNTTRLSHVPTPPRFPLDTTVVLRFNPATMQTLGVSNSTPDSDNRLKSLFWPSVNTASDVDYLGAQGYWVCAIVAVFSLIVCVLNNQWIAGVVTFLFYFLGGVGVRERSRYAATVVLIMFTSDTLLTGIGVLRILLAALLLSNMRAIWIASRWKPDSAEAVVPPRFSDTWSDKFADQLPQFLWPKIRILYYIFSIGFFALVAVGFAVLFKRGALHL
jgi:hypothetical protein